MSINILAIIDDLCKNCSQRSMKVILTCFTDRNDNCDDCDDQVQWCACCGTVYIFTPPYEVEEFIPDNILKRERKE